MLPMAGSRTALIVVSGAGLAWALALLAVAPAGRARRLATAAVFLGAFAYGAVTAPEPIVTLMAQRHPNEPMLWMEEGVQTTASVHALGARRAMYLDGYHQAGDDGASRFVHYKIGTLPLALHKNPHKALIIGLGGGATSGAMARQSRLSIDLVELSDTVVRASEQFRHVNFNVLDQPNVHLRVDDGRNYLAATRQRYDIITADLIQPIRAGSASLYSAEYFELVRDALNPDGLALQWFFGTDAEYKLVARTFASVFPHVTVWDDGTLLVGTKQPLKLSPSDFNWKLEVPEYADALSSIGIKSFDDLLKYYRAGHKALMAHVGGGPLLTDDRPTLEYFLALPRDKQLDLASMTRDPREILSD
jgi:spermidine synthase